MAAFTGTPTSAPTHKDQSRAPIVRAAALDAAGVLRIADSGTYTHTATEGSGTGEVNLVTLPGGKVRVYTDLSRLVTTQFAATADLHIGARAHTKQDGTAVAEDDNLFGDNLDVGGGALDAALNIPAAGFHDFDSQDGVTIYAMIDTADIEANDTIRLQVAYVKLS